MLSLQPCNSDLPVSDDAICGVFAKFSPMLHAVDEEEKVDVFSARNRDIAVVNVLHLLVGEGVDRRAAALAIRRRPVGTEDAAGTFEHLGVARCADCPQALDGQLMVIRQVVEVLPEAPILPGVMKA